MLPTKKGGEGWESLVWSLVIFFLINNVRNWNPEGIIVGLLLWQLLHKKEDSSCHLCGGRQRHSPNSKPAVVLKLSLRAPQQLLFTSPACPRLPVAVFLSCPPGASPPPSHVMKDRTPVILCWLSLNRRKLVLSSVCTGLVARKFTWLSAEKARFRLHCYSAKPLPPNKTSSKTETVEEFVSRQYYLPFHFLFFFALPHVYTRCSSLRSKLAALEPLGFRPADVWRSQARAGWQAHRQPCERSDLSFHMPAGTGDNHLTSQRQQSTTVFVFSLLCLRKSAHSLEGANKQMHISQGRIWHRGTKGGAHVHREGKTTLSRKGYTTLQFSASALEGSWGKGVGGGSLLVSTVARISPYPTGSWQRSSCFAHFVMSCEETNVLFPLVWTAMVCRVVLSLPLGFASANHAFFPCSVY